MVTKELSTIEKTLILQESERWRFSDIAVTSDRRSGQMAVVLWSVGNESVQVTAGDATAAVGGPEVPVCMAFPPGLSRRQSVTAVLL